ncbi:LIC10774 family surface protein [Leptospira noguchii]|uniref:LIC10774 family surface protein n=1 Tax=Leptospira noguchii TaxID=28182 RepID=UPI001FB6DAFF|nr:DUF1565 domain-containing protein [Leptospira noguchii]UOG47919.1 DUF1565 domain-containing protein [Leptospira noguchii]
MTRFLLLCLSIILLLGDCTNEKEGRESDLTLLSGIIDQTNLNISNPNKNDSLSLTIRIPLYVDKVVGNDNWPGSKDAPLRTLTKAIALAGDRHDIHVAPGEYSEQTGEKFPIQIPDGATLIGDELGKGLGFILFYDKSGNHPSPKPTTIQFHADDLKEIILLGENSTIAGFNLKNPIALRAYGSKVRNNTISQGIGIFPANTSASGGHTISGNFIGSKKAPGYNYGVGIFIEATTYENKIENNTIYRNRYGVVIRPLGKADLGGGSQRSVGNNTISCSLEIDLTFLFDTNRRLYAQNIKLDHNPPTYETSSQHFPEGVDIYRPGSYGTIDIFGYSLASNPCD